MACTVRSTPRATARVEREQPDTILASVFRKLGLERPVVADIQQEFRLRQVLDDILPFSTGQVLDYFQNAGVIKIKPGGVAEAVGKYNPRDVAIYNRALKVYVEGLGGGLQDLAKSFLRKVDSGEKATVEGVKFLGQVKQVSELTKLILRWDQDFGLAVRAQGLMPGMNVGSAFNVEATAGLDPQAMNESVDVLADLIGKLGRRDTEKEALEGIYEMAVAMQFSDNPLQAFRSAGTLGVSGGMWKEAWINGLLSSPATFVTNACR